MTGPDEQPAPQPEPTAPRVLHRPSWPEAQVVADALRTETIGGALLLAAAVAALVSPTRRGRDAYFTVRDTAIGIEWGHLDLTVGHWAADGLLAIFFFVAGLELKREFLVGDLRSPAKAVVPDRRRDRRGRRPVALVFLGTVALVGADGDALPGVGDPDRHRHRLRPGRARRHRLAPARRRCARSC